MNKCNYIYTTSENSGCRLTGWKTNSYSEWENQQLSIGYSHRLFPCEGKNYFQYAGVREHIRSP